MTSIRIQAGGDIICQHCGEYIQFDSLSIEFGTNFTIESVHLIKDNEHAGIITQDGRVCHDAAFWPECYESIIGYDGLE